MIPFRRSVILVITVSVFIAAAFQFRSSAQNPRKPPTRTIRRDESVESPIENDSPSEMRPIIEYYLADRGSLLRSFPVTSSPARRERFRKFDADALERIQKLNFDAMTEEGKVDYILFRNHLEHELRQLDIEAKQQAEIQPLIPFAQTIIDLEEARRRMEPINSAKTADTLNELKRQVDDARRSLETQLRGSVGNPILPKRTAAFRAANTIGSLRGNLRSWYTFYNGYDPMFTWWNELPYKGVDDALTAYISFLNERVVGVRSEATASTSSPSRGVAGGTQGQLQRSVTPRAGDTSDIVGDPIGRDALISELQYEMIPYTPEELIAFANKEMAWCENEMKKASRDLGYGDDWKKALEHVKNLYVEPGKQPEMIRDLALEAIKFVDDHDLITVP